ncbi:MAG: A/G-specific adenine glycosylase [Verrucomicrobiales bacterium]|nr:A/G-specific adenine glycosylase [Verrucomicrobiales bacterium]|tara:strand:+ start:1060 stop:2106 length:1047 start_codon:yes stop_codon:yes gene_type:complete
MSQELKSLKSTIHPMLDRSEPFRRSLLNWFHANAKDYPWRTTKDPYEILVSEMMLQQTQVVTVLGRGYYRRWLESFPDFKSLAAADESEVLRVWEGLGYYSRARNLHKLAKVVVHELGNQFPSEVVEIESLPGIGKYTAGAIASFAFNSSVPAVDANIARVIVRIFDFQERIDTSYGQKKIWGWANDMVPSSGARAWNSALMELGQTLCKPRVVLCDECPLSACCQSSQPLDLPIKKSKPQMTSIDEHVILAVSKSKVLLEQEKGRRRHGMWKLPARDGKDLKETKLLSKQKYGITRYKMTMHIYQSDNPCARENEQWFKMNELQSLPMPSPYRRALKLINEVSAQEN